MLHGDSEGKHGTEMEDILIMYFVAKSHAHSYCHLASVVASALNWAELRTAI